MSVSNNSYAEYEHAAPQFMANSHPSTLTTSYYGTKPEGGMGSDAEASMYASHEFKPVGGAAVAGGGYHKKRTILGLAPWKFFTLLVLVVLVIVGVVVGVVFGTRSNNNNSGSASSAARTNAPTHTSSIPAPSQLPQTPTTPTTTPTTSTSTSTPTPTAFTIHQAVYGSRNITEKSRTYILQDKNLVINMMNTDPWGLPDPWFGIKKCLSILFSLGPSSIRTFVACEGDGSFMIVPGKTNSLDKTREISRQGPSSDDFAIVSVVWGAGEVVDADVYRRIYEARNAGSKVEFSNDFFGGDSMLGIQKSGVIYYTEDGFETFKGIFAREGESVGF